MKTIGAPCEVGECPVWTGSDWLWVDNVRGMVCTPNGESAADAVCAVPKSDGGLLVVTAHEVTGHATPAGTRFNDGKCDGLGRLWIGTMAASAGSPGRGVLFCFDGHDLRAAADGFDVCNGLGWSPDHRLMYFTDTGRRVIYRYDFDLAAGMLGDRSVFHHFPDGGKPDGLAVDAEGCVWSALWDGACLVRLSPDGEIIDQIDLPVQRPTSVAFGNGEMLITSARMGLTPAQLTDAPLSGLTFLMPSPLAGMPVAAFRG